MKKTIIYLVLSALSALGSSTTDDGLTPLHIAAGRGDTAKVKALLEGGADPNALDSKIGVSVLHKAVYSGNAETVEILLEHGSLINLQSPSNGDTPLHDSIYFKREGEAVIKVLLKHFPSLSIQNRAGLTPLGSARLLKDTAVIKLLEDEEKHRTSEAGKKLMASVKSNDLKKVKLLLKGKPNLEEPDSQGFTPLLWASREGYDDIVRELLNAGADPNHLDQWMGATSGHKAAFWGRAAAMRLLVTHGLDVNARGGYNGYTALHDAVSRGHVEVVKVLLEAKARKEIQGHDGLTALDIAKKLNHKELIALLQ
jgi:ankyrin repeat protein